MKRKILVIYLCTLLLIPLFASTAIANDPPLPPTIDGPKSVEPGKSYEFEFCGEDPNGDDIQICVDFGDGSGNACYGPFPSGTCMKLDHIFETEGTYTITAYCTDIPHQTNSDDTTFTVVVEKSKSRNIHFGIFLQFLKNFPLINYILGL
jgi:hypothetical protein